MKWWHYCFDRSWIRCSNYGCRKEFTYENYHRKLKCPSCGMDNKHYVNAPKDVCTSSQVSTSKGRRMSDETLS